MLGLLTGLVAEARIAAGLGRAAAGGGTPAGARDAAERLAGAGVEALLSFGLAGGLDPALRPGDVLVPARVLAPGRVWQADPALRARLGTGSDAPLWSGGAAVTDAAAKRLLFEASGAASIDLESAAAAAVAARYGLPFAVLRVVCDPAERALPPAALLALDAAGRIALWRVLGSLARRPGQLAALLALARDAAAARRALVRRVHEIGARGGLVA